MIEVERNTLETRLLLLGPTAKDAAVTQAVLAEAGITCVPYSHLYALLRDLRQGAGAILVAEEALANGGQEHLTAVLAEQPPWSDVPVLILAHRGADSPIVLRAMEVLSNVTLLERPARVVTLVSTVRSALRARQRQYQIRAYLLERERSAEALREADRRKDEFLATLAHELRNPLAPIRSGVELLRIAGQDPAVVEHVQEVMERQVQHLVRLVDDLLEISRITRGRIELRRQLVDLADAIQGAVETSRPLIDAGGHRLTIALPEERLTVDADPVRLAQVFANLLNNAARYTPEPGDIRVSVTRDRDEAVVKVRDSGIGIAPDQMPYVFEMFTRGLPRASHGNGGLGVGLALVRSLVRMHGGRVAAHSGGLGQGSEFEVRLPLATPEPALAAPRDEPFDLRTSPRRVLVVDDSRDAAESLALLLRYLGAEVEVALSGQEALDCLEHWRPDLVLLDIGMPEMDGYEVARRIRRHPRLGALRLVALSGWGQDEDRRRSRAAGFDEHLVKPADADTLQNVLTSLEHRRRPVEALPRLSSAG